ncbi:MAG: alanine racemase [Kiloniellales bacterium]
MSPDSTAADLSGLETPCLLLDRAVLARNAARFQAIAQRFGVKLRPHLKTSKSLEVAAIATAGDPAPSVTVSTLAEAEYFAAAGYRDILYGVGMAPGKLARAGRLLERTDLRLLLVTDNVAMAEAAAAAPQPKRPFEFLIEIDCGDRRGGVPAQSAALLEVARALTAGGRVELAGVMTHAGQSYGTRDAAEIAAIAEQERAAAVGAAGRLRAAGFEPGIVSVGSTPTAAFVRDLTGVTEMRPGVYLFFDLDQLARGVCEPGDLALSVLGTVIGHNRAAGKLLLDCGGLALSKDRSAGAFLPDAGYGYLCDPARLTRLGPLAVTAVSQEHGHVAVADTIWFERLPVGSQVRVLPNHACFTAAAYPHYHLLDGGRVAGLWPRVNGW